MTSGLLIPGGGRDAAEDRRGIHQPLCPLSPAGATFTHPSMYFACFQNSVDGLSAGQFLLDGALPAYLGLSAHR